MTNICETFWNVCIENERSEHGSSMTFVLLNAGVALCSRINACSPNSYRAFCDEANVI